MNGGYLSICILAIYDYDLQMFVCLWPVLAFTPADMQSQCFSVEYNHEGRQ